MKKTQLSLIAAALVLLVTTNVQADTALQKLGRGFAGLAFGFLEIPANLNQETEARGGPLGFPIGLVKGTGMMVGRYLVGAYEVISAPIPFPEDYQAILQPEYPWGYFK